VVVVEDKLVTMAVQVVEQVEQVVIITVVLDYSLP
jgi:hypothetical protein